MPTDREVNKEDVVHIYNGALFSHKKRTKQGHLSDMDRPRDCHNEWCKSETDILQYRSYVESKEMLQKVQMNLFTKQKALQM